MIATSTYGELDPERENRLMWSFKGKKRACSGKEYP